MGIPINPEVVEVVTATSAFIGAVIMGFKKAGLVTFGKPAERRKYDVEVNKVCAKHVAMAADIETIKTNSAERLTKVNEIDQKIDKLSYDMGCVIGFLQGKNGYHT